MEELAWFKTCHRPGNTENRYIADFEGNFRFKCYPALNHAASADDPGRSAFAVPCRVSEPGQPGRTETLTAVICTAPDPAVQGYFVGLLDFLMDLLGPTPTLAATADAVEHLVDLFQRLRRPARKTVTGLVGELCVIAAARQPDAAVAAWRTDVAERFDFVRDILRLEAKASGGGHRVRSLSYEQANPPEEAVGLLASVLVQQAAGGTSLAEMVAGIEAVLSDYTSVMRLRAVLADTLGQELPAALGWRFDMARARDSLAFFDLRAIPAIRGTIPAQVSGIRFTCDLSGFPAARADSVLGITPAAMAILPL